MLQLVRTYVETVCLLGCLSVPAYVCIPILHKMGVDLLLLMLISLSEIKKQSIIEFFLKSHTCIITYIHVSHLDRYI